MSQALPMSTERRIAIYERRGRLSAFGATTYDPIPSAMVAEIRQWSGFTDRQARQVVRMQRLAALRDRGELKHGATGERIRRPLTHQAQPSLRGSISTHLMKWCPRLPCPEHGERSRLQHRQLIEATP